jgi:hypothetical protein
MPPAPTTCLHLPPPDHHHLPYLPHPPTRPASLPFIPARLFSAPQIRALCAVHGAQLQGGSAASMPSVRLLQKVLNRMHEDLASSCEGNLYTLEYLTTAGAAGPGAARMELEVACGRELAGSAG